jgi:hypothetical protein
LERKIFDVEKRPVFSAQAVRYLDKNKIGSFKVFLCAFASAGADESFYTVELPIEKDSTVAKNTKHRSSTTTDETH